MIHSDLGPTEPPQARVGAAPAGDGASRAYARDSQGLIRVGGWLGFVLLLHLALDAALWIWALVDWQSLRTEFGDRDLFNGLVASAFWAWGTLLFFSRSPARRHARRVLLVAPFVSTAVGGFDWAVTGADRDALVGLGVSLGIDGLLVAYLLASARVRATLHSHRPGPATPSRGDTAAWCTGLLGAALVLGCLPSALQGGAWLALPVAAAALVALFHRAVSAFEARVD
jgi:hypothetical protein